MEQIKLPVSVYSETHSPKLSEKYVHIKTANILDQFAGYGWMVASSNSPRYSKTPEFARHALRLRHKDFPTLDADSVVPELIVLNSHNGSWALRMALGMFRMVCSNGMVAGTLWEGVTVKHYQLKNLEEKIQTVTSSMNDLSQRLVTCVHDWSDLQVPLKDQLDFAKDAMAIRWGEKTPVEPTALLIARRDADKGDNLWRLFNRVQENLTQGGLTGHMSNGHTLNIKAIKNVKRDFSYNQKLWSLADGYHGKLLGKS